MYDFERANFFPFKRQFKLEDLDKILSYSLIESNIVNNYLINDISSLRKIRNNSLIFLKEEINNLNLAKKNVHIITNVKENINYYDSFTLVKDLNSSFNTILNKLFLHEDQTGYLDEYDIINGSYISKFSNIDKSVEIGRNSLVARGVEIGKNCIIGAKALITEKMDIPDGSMVMGIPARITRQLSTEEQELPRLNSHFYVENAKRFRKEGF